MIHGSTNGPMEVMFCLFPGLVHDSTQIETDMVEQLLKNEEAKLYHDSWVHQWTDGGKVLPLCT